MKHIFSSIHHHTHPEVKPPPFRHRSLHQLLWCVLALLVSFITQAQAGQYRLVSREGFSITRDRGGKITEEGKNTVRYADEYGFVWVAKWSDPNPTLVNDGGEATVDLDLKRVATGSGFTGVTIEAFTDGHSNGDNNRKASVIEGSGYGNKMNSKATLKAVLKMDGNRSERTITVRLDGNDGLATLAVYHFKFEEGSQPPPNPPNPPQPQPPQPGINLGGDWTSVFKSSTPALPAKIIQNGGALTFINEYNQTSSGSFVNATTVKADNFVGGMKGTISSDGNKITWANGAVWTRGTVSVSKMTLKAGVYPVKQGVTFDAYVYLLKGTGLTDMNFNLTYDPSIAVTTGNVARGNLLDGASFEANARNAGKVEVGFVPKSGGVTAPEGTVAVVTFKAVGKTGSRTPLTLVPRKSSTTAGAADVAAIHGEILIVDKESVLGDANGDGFLDLRDATDALKMSVHLIDVNMNADVDKDGEVTAKDARLIAEKVSGKNVF